MTVDIFDFWSAIDPGALIHPEDQAVFDRVPDHGFDLSVLPGCFMGPLKTAPVVLLYLSPGLSDDDHVAAPITDWHVQTRRGEAPLVSRETHPSAHGWWSQRTKRLGAPEDLSGKVAFLNIGAYHSKTFDDHGLLAALPSSRVSLGWAQDVLFPAAERGERVVICMRAAGFWGLQAGAMYPGSLFAPRVTRSGHVRAEDRDEIITAVQTKLAEK